MKSKGVAYLLLLFLGFFGAHKFYLDRIGMGFLYLFTGGLFFVGAIIDLFTLGGQVDAYNATKGGKHSQPQNITVNVAHQPAVAQHAPTNNLAEIEKLADLKAKGILTDEEFQRKKTQLLS